MNVRSFRISMLVAGCIAMVSYFGEGSLVFASRQSRETPVVMAVRKTEPAVVNIRSVNIVERRDNPFSSWGSDDFFSRFFEDFFEPRMPRRRALDSLGSGVIIDGDRGFILTNQHVIAAASVIQVVLSSGEEYKAQVIGADPDSDLAVLKISAPHELPAARMGKSDDLMIGETVIAIGNPFGFSHTVTTGVISANRRSFRTKNRVFHDFIQTDAAINPGNSGGPLLNIDGELIGINTAIYSKAEGIGFAIPIDRAETIVNQLIKYGEVHAGWIGLDVQDLTDDLSRHFKTPAGKGVIVTGVADQSPASRAGIMSGDVIIRINEQEIAGRDDFEQIFTKYLADSFVTLEYYRKGEKRTARIKAAVFPNELAYKWLFDATGLKLKEISARAENAEEAAGMEITFVRPDSIADRIGLRAGDIVLEINEIALRSKEDLRKAIAKYRRKGPANFLVQRGRYGYNITMKL